MMDVLQLVVTRAKTSTAWAKSQESRQKSEYKSRMKDYSKNDVVRKVLRLCFLFLAIYLIAQRHGPSFCHFMSHLIIT